MRAVHNAVVLEGGGRRWLPAGRMVPIHRISLHHQELQDKHYYRKHGGQRILRLAGINKDEKSRVLINRMEGQAFDLSLIHVNGAFLSPQDFTRF